MQATSNPRKNITSIINNIRQMASDISKDTMAQIALASPQPTQDQHQESQKKTSKYGSIHARSAQSSRITLDSQPNIPEDQPSLELQEIAQGIQNAHVKVDEALRFMTDMKNRLEPTKSLSVTPSANQPASKAIGEADQPKLHKPVRQTGLQSFSKAVENSSGLGKLPMTLEELTISPNATPTAGQYLVQGNAYQLNPFAKPTSNKPVDSLTSIGPNTSGSSLSSIAACSSNMNHTVPSLNFISNPNIAHIMNYQAEKTPSNGPNMTYNYPSTTTMSLPVNLVSQQYGMPGMNPTANMQSACDHTRLNQIILGIKQRDSRRPVQSQPQPIYHQQQPQSLNDLQLGHAQDFGMRPNTVSHLSRAPVSSNWFVPPTGNNFYQLPPENSSSHFSSHNSHYGASNGYMPVAVAPGFSGPVNYMPRAGPSIYSGTTENYEDTEEVFKPRRLTFEDQRNTYKAVASGRTTPAIKEVRAKKQRVQEPQFNEEVSRQKNIKRKTHKTDTQKRHKDCEDVITDEDSMIDEYGCGHHHQCQKRRVKRAPEHTESSFSSQSDEEESLEEAIEYKSKKTARCCGAENRAQVCSNCSRNAVKGSAVATRGDKVSGSVRRRSNSRKQKVSVESNEGLFNETITTNQTEDLEYRSQASKRTKSIDSNQIKGNLKRRIRVQNDENYSVSIGVEKASENSKSGFQPKKVSLESLRRKDESQMDLRTQTTTEMNTKRTYERQTTVSSLYDRAFVDQLAVDFPCPKGTSLLKERAVVQKTEVMRSGSQKARRLPM